MKNTDKITMTIGQLKRLIKESGPFISNPIISLNEFKAIARDNDISILVNKDDKTFKIYTIFNRRELLYKNDLPSDIENIISNYDILDDESNEYVWHTSEMF